MSDTSPRVLPISVVIPAFKAERFIGEALDSVAAQTAQPSEVIVVDDGSPDQGAVLARNRGATVITRNREGVSAARNAGILASGQPWIAFLDADDIWEPRKLEQQWLAVEHCPDLGAVFCDYTEFDDHGTSDRTFLSRKQHFHAIKRHEIAPNVMLCDQLSLQQQFFKGNFIVPSTMLVRRDLLMRVALFDPELTHCEDRECWLRLLAVARMAVAEQSLMRSRVHDANASGQRVKMLLGAAKVTDRIVANPGRYPPGAAAAYSEKQPDVYLNAGRLVDELGDSRLAGRYYRQAWRVGGGVRPLLLAALTLLPPITRRLARAAIRVISRCCRSVSDPGVRSHRPSHLDPRDGS
jgi:hypothetical protein